MHSSNPAMPLHALPCRMPAACMHVRKCTLCHDGHNPLLLPARGQRKVQSIADVQHRCQQLAEENRALVERLEAGEREAHAITDHLRGELAVKNARVGQLQAQLDQVCVYQGNSLAPGARAPVLEGCWLLGAMPSAACCDLSRMRWAGRAQVATDASTTTEALRQQAAQREVELEAAAAAAAAAQATRIQRLELELNELSCFKQRQVRAPWVYVGRGSTLRPCTANKQ